MSRPTRAISVLLCLIMMLPLVSCGDAEPSFVFEPLDTKSAETASPVFEIVPVDPASAMSAYIDDAAVRSANYSVSKTVFDVLFNYVIIKQLAPGDGDYDEYDYYFASGLLDPLGSVQGQKLPGSDTYWLSDAVSKTLVIVCEALHYFEFASYRGIPAFSRVNAKKVEREMTRIRDKEYGGTIEELFGDVTEDDVYLAVILKTIYDDPSAISVYFDYDTFPRTQCSYAQPLSPSLSDGVRLAAEFFQQK